jgi:hypothetical protein
MSKNVWLRVAEHEPNHSVSVRFWWNRTGYPSFHTGTNVQYILYGSIRQLVCLWRNRTSRLRLKIVACSKTYPFGLHKSPPPRPVSSKVNDHTSGNQFLKNLTEHHCNYEPSHAQWTTYVSFSRSTRIDFRWRFVAHPRGSTVGPLVYLLRYKPLTACTPGLFTFQVSKHTYYERDEENSLRAAAS